MGKGTMQSAQVRPTGTHSPSGTSAGSSRFIPSRIMGAGLMGPSYRVKIESTRLDVGLLSEIFREHLESNGSGVGTVWEGDAISRDLITSV